MNDTCTSTVQLNSTISWQTWSKSLPSLHISGISSPKGEGVNLAKDERGKDMACGHSFSGGEPITLKCKRKERKEGRKEERKEEREEEKEGRKKERKKRRKEEEEGRKKRRKKERKRKNICCSLKVIRSPTINGSLWYITPSSFLNVDHSTYLKIFCSWSTSDLPSNNGCLL